MGFLKLVRQALMKIFSKYILLFISYGFNTIYDLNVCIKNNFLLF